MPGDKSGIKAFVCCPHVRVRIQRSCHSGWWCGGAASARTSDFEFEEGGVCVVPVCGVGVFFAWWVMYCAAAARSLS